MIWLLLAWWLIGYIGTIYEMRHDFDVDLGWMLCAIPISLAGPFIFLMVLRRKPIIVLKKFDNR